MFKILLLKNCKEDEAENWRTCIGHCSLQKLCFLFRQIRTLVTITTYCFHRLMILKFSTVSLLIIEFYFYRNVY